MDTKEITFKTKYVRDVTPTVYESMFETKNNFNFEPGQLINVIIPGIGKNGKDGKRAYSIASSPNYSSVELCIKRVRGGAGSNYLYGLKPNDKLKTFGPYGKFVYHPRNDGQVCFISTGTGIAPFRAIINSSQFIKNHPPKTLCLFGVRGVDELLYDDELKNNPLVDWIPCVTGATKNWQGFKGRVTDYLKTLVEFDWKNTDFYLCGNGQMIKEAIEILKAKNINKERIFREKYF